MTWWMDILIGMVAFLVMLKGTGLLLRLWAEHQLRRVVQQLRQQRYGNESQS